MSDAEMRKKTAMDQGAPAESTGNAFWDQVAGMLKANNQELKDTIDLKVDIKLNTFERNVDNRIAAETEAHKAEQHRIGGKFDEVLKRLDKLEVGGTADSTREPHDKKSAEHKQEDDSAGWRRAHIVL